MRRIYGDIRVSLNGRDLKLRKQMQLELKRIQQEVGITFIYVTHDQEEAMTMSDRIAVMNRGRYEQLGEPEVLYERPTTRFVAGFLGASNLLQGTVEGSDAIRLGAELREWGSPEARPWSASAGAQDLQKCAVAAKAGCPISRLLNTTITMDANLES